MCCCCVQRLPASPDGCWRGCSPPAVVVVDEDVRCWVCRSPRLAREGSPLLGDLVGLLSLGLGLAGLLDLGPEGRALLEVVETLMAVRARSRPEVLSRLEE